MSEEVRRKIEALKVDGDLFGQVFDQAKTRRARLIGLREMVLTGGAELGPIVARHGEVVRMTQDYRDGLIKQRVPGAHELAKEFEAVLIEIRCRYEAGKLRARRAPVVKTNQSDDQKGIETAGSQNKPVLDAPRGADHQDADKAELPGPVDDMPTEESGEETGDDSDAVGDKGRPDGGDRASPPVGTGMHASGEVQEEGQAAAGQGSVGWKPGFDGASAGELQAQPPLGSRFGDSDER